MFHHSFRPSTGTSGSAHAHTHSSSLAPFIDSRSGLLGVKGGGGCSGGYSPVRIKTDGSLQETCSLQGMKLWERIHGADMSTSRRWDPVRPAVVLPGRFHASFRAAPLGGGCVAGREGGPPLTPRRRSEVSALLCAKSILTCHLSVHFEMSNCWCAREIENYREFDVNVLHNSPTSVWPLGTSHYATRRKSPV